MSEHAETEAPKKKLTVDVGVATIVLGIATVVGAMITAIGAIVVAILATRHGGTVPIALPTVTVTASPHPGAVATVAPHPTVTVTKFVLPHTTIEVRTGARPWYDAATNYAIGAVAIATATLGWETYRRLKLSAVRARVADLKAQAEAVRISATDLQAKADGVQETGQA